MLEQPLIIPIAEGKYKLVEDYYYYWVSGNIEQQLIIPKGFHYDGASVPRIAWSLSGITPDGLIRAAALVHDYIYRYEGRLPLGSHIYFNGFFWETAPTLWTRKEADRMFGRLMREGGVSKLKRRLAYLAVRLFGGSAW